MDNSSQNKQRRERLRHYSQQNREKLRDRERELSSMAVSSISATLIPSIPLPNSSPFPSKPKLSSFSFYTCKASKLKALKPSLPSTRVYAAPEVLESPETLDPPLETPDESDPTTFEVCNSCPFCFVLLKFCLVVEKMWEKENIFVFQIFSFWPQLNLKRYLRKWVWFFISGKLKTDEHESICYVWLLRKCGIGK